MKNFLRRLKRRLILYIVFCLIIAACLAWLYIFYHPVAYKASAELILADSGWDFLVKEGFVENPAKISNYKNVQFNISSDSKALEIIARGEDPSEVARRANIVAEKYKSEIEKNCLAVLQKGQTRQLKEIESSRIKYRTELGKINENLEVLDAKLQALEAEHDSTEAASSSLQRRISSLEIHRDALLRVYTESHPEVEGIDFELNSLREKLDSLPVIEGLDALERSIAGQKARYKDVQQKLLQLEQQKSALFAKDEKPPATISRYATKPAAPAADVDPNDVYTRFLLSGFLIGLAASLIATAFKDTIVSEFEISNIPKLPLIATIPFVKPKKGQRPKVVTAGKKSMSNQLLFLYDDSSEYVNAYRSLATHIKLDAFKDNIDKKVIIFTSPTGRIGKSTVSANLALSLARSGKKTALLDANLNRTSVAKFFAIKTKVHGISDILIGKAKLEDCLINVTDMLLSGVDWDMATKTYGLDRLKILTSGTRVSDPVGLLESQAVAELFKQLREEFDCIVVDSPTLLRSPDSIILSSYADGIFLVCKTHFTSYRDIVKCSKKLEKVKIEFKGGILICI